MLSALSQPRSATLLSTVSRSIICNRGSHTTIMRCDTSGTSNVPHETIPVGVNPMWENTEWSNRGCQNMLPRYDDLHYRDSDKTKRLYKQTWVECPEIPKKIKICTCFQKLPPPPIERRPRNTRPRTACNMQEMCCPDKRSKCTRIRLPGCASRRTSFHCLVDKNPRPLCQNKRCAPCPSFSECTHEALKPKRYVESACTEIPNTCEVWAAMEKALRMGLRK